MPVVVRAVTEPEGLRVIRLDVSGSCDGPPTKRPPIVPVRGEPVPLPRLRLTATAVAQAARGRLEMGHVPEATIERRDGLARRPGALREGRAAPLLLIRAGLPPPEGPATTGCPLLGKRVPPAVPGVGVAP